ncbi:hypothetical protein GLOIN_2v1782886, partial [Rhizophagus irregularis DAOM 181602=DAOM 197198]
KAFYWYQKAAEKDHIDAQCNLAYLYKNGKGTEENLEKAFYWYQKAAERNSINAQYNLARLNSEGTEKNLEKAFYWYQKAAENNDKYAMNNLAVCYNNGEGTEKNFEKAFYWYQKAAEMDHIDAQYYLARLYDNGQGTERNLEKAFYLYQKAAEKNQIKAQYNLACIYYAGEVIEKNLEKSFYWYQRAAEGGNTNAMSILALYYVSDDEGILEKNLEKAFYWNQKAAENGNEIAQHNLASLYYYGKGTERNLEKAFYWNQKAAENDSAKSQYNLACLYYNGEGTEKNLEKAFYWNQKAAEKDHIDAQYHLASMFYNGEGTERNLEKAFYWYHKAAKSGNEDAMGNLIICYKYAMGIEKDLEKAFYWYQKVTENSKVNSGKCKECNQLYIGYQWCQQCNSKRFQQDFLKWTSGNKFIDKFIQDAQLNAKNINEVLEWIPYNKLNNINYYDKGGFGTIDKAIWLDGPIDSWDFDKQQWNRWTLQKGYEVILKNLNNFSDLDDEFLNEWKYNYNCQKKSFSKFVRFFGITQDPNSLNYMIVMSYVKEGSLRKCLPNIVKLNWYDKLQLLKKIILGLKIIHESGLVHRDLHDGNILISNNEIYIIDLGLCNSVSNLQNSENIYGVMPYIAPEVLRGNPYTSASDIYSFSMIMWEFTSGVPPFYGEEYDYQLNLSICEGERPEIIKNTPENYKDLMKACWDSEPTKRPTLKAIESTISEWLSFFNKYIIVDGIEHMTMGDTDTNSSQVVSIMREFAKALERKQFNTSTFAMQSHPSECDKIYSFEILDENFISNNSDCLDCII